MKEIEDENKELYNHENDPEEHINVADHPEYQAAVDRMRRKLDARRKNLQLMCLEMKLCPTNTNIFISKVDY